MIQVTPQMRILLAVEPVDFRKGIDGLAGICRNVFKTDPFSGFVFVFMNKKKQPYKSLCMIWSGILAVPEKIVQRPI